MKYVSFLFIFTMLFSNCNSTSKINSEKNKSILEGTYLITSLYGEDVSEHKLTMVFDSANNLLTGFSGCNSYSCNYSSEGKSFSAKFPMASKKYCSETAKIEKQFFKALTEMKEKEFKNKILSFQKDQGEEILTAKK